MASARAILLEYAQDRWAAIAFGAMIEVLDRPPCARVPLAPPHCDALLDWHGDLLPVLDLAAWSGRAPAAAARFCAVVAYREGTQRRYGALRALTFPRIVEVDDGMAAALPDARWRGFARACFETGGDAVPVLALRELFETPDAGGADDADGNPPGMLQYEFA